MDAAPDDAAVARVEAELADIELALRRLDDHTYDVCEKCGGPISAELLDRHPASRRCERHTDSRSPAPAKPVGGAGDVAAGPN